MKKLFFIIAMVFTASAVTMASNSGSKSSKGTKVRSTNRTISDLMLSAPVKAGEQSVLVSFSVDNQGVMHVQQVLTNDESMKTYVFQHLNGKRINLSDAERERGVVKLVFHNTNNSNLYFQY
ncbi:MAG: hypothetical protein U0U66_04790 [Cytophagaceae bacterium]